MIPDEAVEGFAADMFLSHSAARRILEAAAPHLLSHFANRIDWRCSECEDQIDPDTALRKLQEEAAS